MPLRGRIALWFILIASGWGFLCPKSQAYEGWNTYNHIWNWEAQINTVFLGHVGSSTVQNGPRTGFMLQGDFGIWWQHAIRLDVHLGHSLTGDSAWSLGAGLKFSLIELGVRDAEGYYGGRRGIFASGRQSIIIFLETGVTRYIFSALNPASLASYPLTQTAYFVGAGIQWGLGYDVWGTDRVFIEPTVRFSRMNQIFYALPHIGLGFNF